MAIANPFLLPLMTETAKIEKKGCGIIDFKHTDHPRFSPKLANCYYSDSNT
ncbi:protein of unknown function [Latilactobacillus sakei]|nr:protein of unknown function [Latilactobacillus sakei]